jgi:alkylation response protein AidB-like acyl-CoA dehydrogenase
MFELNKSQKQIQKAVRSFAKGEFDKELVLELDRSGEYPSEIHAKAAELGFIGIHYPESFSGGGLGFVEQALVAEELCAADSSLGITLTMAGYGAECLLRFGTAEQKEAFLPGVAEGRDFCGAAFTEPGNGYDITKLSCVAVRKNGNFKITGKKAGVINGTKAGFYLVLCQTDLMAQPFTAGSSLFIVEADREGIVVEEAGERLSLNMMPVANVEFVNVEVPETNLIGEMGKGYDYVQKFLAESRLLAAAQALGVARGAYERAMFHIKNREQFNRPIGLFQAVRHKIADMATHITLSRLVTYHTAELFDSGVGDAESASIAKMAACKSAMEVTNEAVQLLGGYGYMREYEVEHFYRDAKMLEIRDGNQYLHKDVIADAEIGKLKSRS